MRCARTQGKGGGGGRRLRRWVGLALLVAMCGSGCAQFRIMRDSRNLTQRWEGVASPDFAFKTLDGEHVRRDAILGQRAVFLFWAPWCTVCRHEIPEMNRLAAGLTENAPQIFAISFEDEASVRQFLAEQPIQGRAAVVADGELPVPFDLVPAFPAWFVMDAKGRFERVRFGYQGEGAIRAILTGEPGA